MRIPPFYFLTLVIWAYLALGFYLLRKQRPATYWNRIYDKWLKKQSITKGGDQDVIQKALDEAEAKEMKSFSVLFIVEAMLAVLLVLIAIPILLINPDLFFHLGVPVTLMFPPLLVLIREFRRYLPIKYGEYRKISLQRAAQG